MESYKITCYTERGTLDFETESDKQNFEQELTEAIAEGTVMVNTQINSTLILNAINLIAVEVIKLSEIETTTPVQ